MKQIKHLTTPKCCFFFSEISVKTRSGISVSVSSSDIIGWIVEQLWSEIDNIHQCLKTLTTSKYHFFPLKGHNNRDWGA